MRSRILKRNRRGALILVVLACLVVTSAIAVSTLQSSLGARHEARKLRQLRQTELLVRAGVMRAVNRLTRASEYRGEEWRPHLTPPLSHSGAEVGRETELPSIRIRVAEPNQEGAYRIDVVASLGSPNYRNGTIQRSHTFSFKPTTSTSTSTSSETE